jgi:cysteine desulfurase/selenocysteine lyase
MHIVKNKKQLRFAAYSIPNIIAKIDNKTKILAIANVTNLHGYTLDIKNLVQLAKHKNKNIIIVLDATQGIVHNKIDVQDLDIDFMACSAHKMCGPTGIGLAYIKEK